jgi:hypothetical protein
MHKIIITGLIFIFSFSKLMARENPANLDQVDFYDGNIFKFVGATANYTYPSNQLAKMALKFNVKNASIIDNFLNSAEVRLEIVEVKPDGDTLNDGFSQMHCVDVSIISLLENWIKLKNLSGYNKFNIKISLPKSELRMNPDRPSWKCLEYKSADVILN